MSIREVKTMTKRNRRRRRVLAALAASVALTLSAHSGAHRRVAGAAPAAPAECEGNACAQVTLTFDEARQQYRARNDSAERWVKVSAANLAAAASACLGPGEEGVLALRSVVGAYRAEYAEQGCGQTPGGR